MMKTIVSWFTSGSEAKVEPFYRSREVWSYRHVDPVTKKISTKPVLVFRKASDGMFWGLLLTKTQVNGKALYVPRLKNGKKVSVLSQMRTLKAERLMRKIGEAGEREFGSLNSAIVRLLADSQPVKRVVPRARVVRPRTSHYPRTVFPPVYILQPR